MNASFEEKSVWVQLTGTVVGLGVYFTIAWTMWSNGVEILIAYVPVFIGAVVLIVLINAIGHIAAVAFNQSEERDERDRLIGWRSESNSAWILAAGIINAIVAMIFTASPVWVAHLLLATLFVSEVVKNISQLVYYNRGV